MPNKSKKSKAESLQQANQNASKTSEVKHDPVKPGDKAQPTAEQMRIAQIISMQLDDPSLKEKIKQVMDATQKSEDEVCTALHDCDNDPDRAVNLLLEGGQSEWTTSIKKKKAKAVSEKTVNVEDNNSTPAPRAHGDGDSDWDEPEDGNAPTNKFTPDNRGRGSRGGFGFSRTPGRPWRGRDNKDSDNKSYDRGNRGRIPNGAPSGRGRGRGNRGRSSFRGRSMNNWEPSNRMANPQKTVDDWDNEEYQGSLTETKVFTPSAATEVLGSVNEPDMSGKDITFTEPLQTETDKRDSFPPGQFLSQQFTNSSVTQAPPMKTPSSVFQDGHYNSNITTDTFASKFGVSSYSSVTEGGSSNVEEKMARTKTRPRIPPPSKIPSSAVEMPPEVVGSGGTQLDVQFGALDITDSAEHNASSPSQSSASSQSQEVKLAQQPQYQQQPAQQQQQQASVPSSQPPQQQNQQQSIAASDSLLLNETSFSPVRTMAGSTTLPPFNELGMKPESGLYQDYQPSQYSKPHSQASNAGYSQNYSSQFSSSGSGYTSTTTAPQSTNSYSSSINSYTNSSNSYPAPQQTQGGNYNANYPSQSQNLPFNQLHSSGNSYQSGSQYAGNTSHSGSGYGGGASGRLGTSNSYSAPYPTSYTYSNSIHNHKPSPLTATTSTKDFDAGSSGSVNLNSMAQSTNAMNVTPSLLSSTQTTSTTKPSTMGKTVMANMPPGVPPLVGAHTPYIIGSQSGVPYFQQPMYSFEELQQLIPQQRIAPHMATGYFDLAYQTPNTREGVQYNMSDNRQFARADNNASPVPSTNIISQASATQVNQQPLINPPQAYAYFYGGSMIPGNFQYGTPIYPVAATGAGSGHVNTSSVYAKGPNTFTSGYGGSYESGQSSGGDFQKSTGQAPKPSQSNVPASSDLPVAYSKSQHGALSKVNSYEKQSFHSATPPPYLGSQSSSLGPNAYAQHLYVPTMNTVAHHNTALIHQPLHQDGGSASSRSQVVPGQNKVGSKPNYSPSSSYWTPN